MKTCSHHAVGGMEGRCLGSVLEGKCTQQVLLPFKHSECSTARHHGRPEWRGACFYIHWRPKWFSLTWQHDPSPHTHTPFSQCFLFIIYWNSLILKDVCDESMRKNNVDVRFLLWWKNSVGLWGDTRRTEKVKLWDTVNLKFVASDVVFQVPTWRGFCLSDGSQNPHPFKTCTRQCEAQTFLTNCICKVAAFITRLPLCVTYLNSHLKAGLHRLWY